MYIPHIIVILSILVPSADAVLDDKHSARHRFAHDDTAG